MGPGLRRDDGSGRAVSTHSPCYNSRQPEPLCLLAVRIRNAINHNRWTLGARTSRLWAAEPVRPASAGAIDPDVPCPTSPSAIVRRRTAVQRVNAGFPPVSPTPWAHLPSEPREGTRPRTPDDPQRHGAGYRETADPQNASRRATRSEERRVGKEGQ